MKIASQLAVVALVALALSACDKVSHKNIEEWQRTKKGPEKLSAALTGDNSSELRAHAAQILIRIKQLDEVTRALGRFGDAEREGVMAELVQRLWKDAEPTGPPMRMPSGQQVVAKDALFELRELASDQTRDELDSHLISWLTSGYYEGRAKAGRHSGRRVIHAVGQGAGPALIRSAQAILARPQNPDGSWARFGDELLAGLALSGHPDALSLLFDLVESEQRDETIGRRTMTALYDAYVKPTGLTPVPGERLQTVATRLEKIVKASISGRVTNDAIELLAAMGMPACLPPFVAMVSFQHAEEGFRYAGTQKGIRCGGVDGIIPVTEALPPEDAYPRDVLNKYLWREVLALPARKVVAERARSLLDSGSWVARVSGVEILGLLNLAESAEADAERISKLAGDQARLRGWHGKGAKKRDPTLGEVAKQVAARLRNRGGGESN